MIWEQSASLDEKVTQMEAFTSTLLWTSANNTEQDLLLSLMWKDATRMCSLLRRHRRRLGIMRQRTAMLLLGGSSDQTEADFLQLATGGMKSSMRQLEKSFSNYWQNWNRKLSAVVFPVCASSPIGDSELIERLTQPPRDLLSTRNDTLNSMNGYERIWKDISLDDVEGL
nr:MAG: rep protein [Cressdnaviricota sp.]